MSKVEVKVKKGDAFITWCGSLYLAREGSIIRRVADGSAWCGENARIPNFISMEATTLPIPAARAWIEFLGGTVVEEREEEKGGVIVTAHLYQYGNGAIVMSSKRHNDFEETYKYLGTTTIHIAGVTT